MEMFEQWEGRREMKNRRISAVDILVRRKEEEECGICCPRLDFLVRGKGGMHPHIPGTHTRRQDERDV